MDDDLLPLLRRAAKPGHQSGESLEKRQFTQQLISALEAAQQAAETQGADQGGLAAAAYEQLQFDFPLVSAEGLGALAEAYSAGSAYPLTPKFLAVLREGASAAGTAPADKAAPAAAPGGSAGDSGAEEDAREPSTQAAAPAAAPPTLLPLYQRLYATVLVKALQRALAEWTAAQCARQLGPLLPCLPREGAAGLGALGAATTDAAALPRLEAGNEVAPAIPQDTLAAQEDSDDLAYEPLEGGTGAGPAAEGLQRQAGGPSGPQPAAAGWQQEAHLLPTLCCLADQLSWHCLSEDSVWRELGLMQELAACLRAARQHPQFPELAAGVAEPLLRLVVARAGACPAEVASFRAFLDALGLAEAGPPHPKAARLALSAAAMLARQLSAAPAVHQRRLWQEVHASLLPLVAGALEGAQAALAKRARQAAAAARGGAGGAAGAAAGQPAAVQPSKEELYRLAAPCQLAFFYVLHAPPALQRGRLAEALLAGGLFRELALLFVRLAALPAAEPVRCAALLCCAGCPSLLEWAAALPGFKAAALGLLQAQQAEQQQQQQQEAWESEEAVLGPGQLLAAHGALWRLLLEPGPQAGAPLAALLQEAAAAPGTVVRVLALLQLMAAVHQASRGRYLWGAGAGSVEAALRALGEALRQESRAATLGAEAGQQGAGDGAAGERQQLPLGEQAEEAALAASEAAEVAKLAWSAEEQAAALAARRAGQLAPACLKLVKDLLQRQGGAGVGKHD